MPRGIITLSLSKTPMKTIKFAIYYEVNDKEEAIATAAALREALLPYGTISLDSEYQEGMAIKQQVALEPGADALKGWDAIQKVLAPCGGFSYVGDTCFIEGWCLNVGEVIDHLSQFGRSEKVVSANGKTVCVWQCHAVQIDDGDCECNEYGDLFNEQGERYYQEEKPAPTQATRRKATTAFAKAIYKTDKEFLSDLFFGTTHDHMECRQDNQDMAILNAKVQLVAYLSHALHTSRGRQDVALVNPVVASEQIISRLLKDARKPKPEAATLPMISP